MAVMNISSFENLRSEVHALRNAAEYANDAVVDGAFNHAELLITPIQDPDLKNRLLKMLQEIKTRNKPFNNNQKLMALESFCDNVINFDKAQKLFHKPEKLFNVNEAINRAKWIKDNKVENDGILRYQYVNEAYKAANMEKERPVTKFVIEIGKWIIGVLTALLVAYLIFRLGWV